MPCRLILVVLFIALGSSKDNGTPPAAAPLEVEVAQVAQKDVPIYGKWIGTLDGMVNAEIRAASAAIEAAKAALETARVTLGFTRLISPIDGIAGVARAQAGNLVSLATKAVTTVSTVDPIKVNFTVSEQEYVNFARRETP